MVLARKYLLIRLVVFQKSQTGVDAMRNLQTSLAAVLFATAAIGGSVTVFAEEPSASELGLMRGFAPSKETFVDATNWTIYPFNRWGFQNVRRFHPTAALPNDPRAVIPLETASQNLDQLPVELPGGETRAVRAIMESWQTDAIVVLHEGKLVYERYWNGMSPTQPHWIASVSKSFIGTYAAMLVDRGVLDQERTIESYVPELAESGFKGATIRQLLDMTAGTAWDESPEQLADAKSPARLYGAASGIWMIPGVRSTGVAGFLPTIGSSRAHGESFVYNSPQVDVLGWAVTNVTKKPLDRSVGEEIWAKLGTECEGYYFLDGGGAPSATGGMVICARDMARFGQMILNGGHFGGRQIVPDSVITKIQTLGDKAAFAKGSHADVYPNGAYRDFWWLTNDDDGAFMAKGIFGQYIYVNPRRQVVIARQASEKLSADKRRFAEVETAFKTIAARLSPDPE